MKRCNLSFNKLKCHLDFMFRKELLRIVAEDIIPDHDLFETSDKNKKFLKTYSCSKALLK
jgi:hypothetical protein